MDWTSVRQCAERLKLTHPAILRAIKESRIRPEAVRRNGRGRIMAVDVDQVARDMQLNSDPLQALRHRGEIPQPGDQAEAPSRDNGGEVEDPGAGSDTVPPTSSSASAKDPHGYYEARAKREQFQAKQAELDYLEALGLLVSHEEMRRVSGRRYKIVRDKFINLADRVSPLVPEQFRAQIWAAIDKEVKRCLNELADDAAAEAARGAPERVAS